VLDVKFLRGSALEKDARMTALGPRVSARKALLVRRKINEIIQNLQPCCDFRFGNGDSVLINSSIK
jgi:hypothetical protein